MASAPMDSARSRCQVLVPDGKCNNSVEPGCPMASVPLKSDKSLWQVPYGEIPMACYNGVAALADH
eukprot:1161175-Pelagomonas_calceolata.AAC.6